MSKWEDNKWKIFWSWVVLAIFAVTMSILYRSERTKRAELEQKLSDCEDVGKMSRIQDRPLLKKMLEGNYIDSVGIGESRTWMRPKGTDSIIEVTDESRDS